MNSRNFVLIECERNADAGEVCESIYRNFTVTDTSKTAVREDGDYPMLAFTRFHNRKMLLNLYVDGEHSIVGHVIDCGASTKLTPGMAFDFMEQVSYAMKHGGIEGIKEVVMGNVMYPGEANGYVTFRYQAGKKCVAYARICGESTRGYEDDDTEYTWGWYCSRTKRIGVDAWFKPVDEEFLKSIGIFHGYEFYKETPLKHSAYSNLEQVSENQYVCYVYVPEELRDVEIAMKIIKIPGGKA